MTQQPTYEELEQRIKELEADTKKLKQAEKEIERLNNQLKKIEIEHQTELLAKEERHRSLSEASPDPIVVYDMAGRVMYVNPAFVQTFGWSFQELSGKRIDFVPEENWPETKTAIERMLKGEKVQLFETRRFTKDRRIIDVQLSTSLFHDRNENPAGNIVILRDVTNQRRAEEALQKAHDELEKRIEARTSELLETNEQLKQEIEERQRAVKALAESETKYRHIVKYAPTGIYELDYKTGKLVSVNDVMCEFTGFTRDELLSMNPFDLLTEESKKYFSERLNKIFSGEEVPESVEYKIKRKDGKELWATLNMRFVYEGKKITGATVVAHDINDRKLAEIALRESEEKYRSILENIEDGYYEVDLAGNFTFFNDAMPRILRYPSDELMGMNNREYMDKDNAKKIYQTFNQVYRTGIPTKAIDWRLIRKDGSECVVETVVSLIKDSQGEAIGFRGIARDVTERHLAEKERKRLETQLYNAERMESLGTLAGGIAHDFNNLLMGIQGRTSLMMMDADSITTHVEHLKGIEDYVKSAADLTKQLLGFARGGKYEVKPTDVNKMIDKSAKMFGRTKKEIIIHKNIQKDIWTVEVDRSQIEQVLLNLYVNAWQSMPSGGDLYLASENVMFDDSDAKPFSGNPGKYVKISITDTGVGMDKATRDRIFDPFFTTKEMGRGTGLGLASVYGIIKNHDGLINVTSEKGEGTTFDIYLPISEKKLIDETLWSEKVDRGTETILLIDDEDMILHVGKAMLEKMGYDVLTANSGTEAIEIYEQNVDEIHLIVLDMVMPEMGGGDTFDRMRAINPDAKILLSSGYSIHGQATDIMERGCNGFIQKPFNMVDLSTKLREILNSE